MCYLIWVEGQAVAAPDDEDRAEELADRWRAHLKREGYTPAQAREYVKIERVPGD